jgi:hypothetical protein
MSKPLIRSAAAFVFTLAIGTCMSDAALAEDKGVQSTVSYPLEAVKKAAADALTVIGCTIKKDESAYVEGVRTRKVGVFVGSGGETVSVALSPAADGKTSVDIRTKKTFVGGAGQKNWDQAVLDEIMKDLSVPQPASGS